MQNCVGEVLLLGIFAVTAYRDWKEQMICVYVPLAAGIAGLVFQRIRGRIFIRKLKNGGFSSIEDIKKIEGIKEGVFSKIKDSIAVN